MPRMQFIGRAWRNHLADMMAGARRSVLVVTPFVKRSEAAWLCRKIPSGVRVTTLANLDADAVSTSALDISGLRCLAETPDSAELIALSGLHAKVFVADDAAAILTSGNLTRSGLDLKRKPSGSCPRFATITSTSSSRANDTARPGCAAYDTLSSTLRSRASSCTTRRQRPGRSPPPDPPVNAHPAAPPPPTGASPRRRRAPPPPPASASDRAAANGR